MVYLSLVDWSFSLVVVLRAQQINDHRRGNRELHRSACTLEIFNGHEHELKDFMIAALSSQFYINWNRERTREISYKAALHHFN